MKLRRNTCFMILLAFTLLAVFPVKAEAAKKVKLNKTNVVLEMGTKETLKVKNTKSKVKWSSADKKIVKVNSKGKLTPISIGSTKVTAKVNGCKYTCRVTVADYTGMSIEQKAVVSYALQFVGNKYRYGGSSLTKGTDCSGFTMSVYKKFGYDLYHNAYQQMKDVKKVKASKMLPGDLIFYGSSKNSVSHVALYIGNGKVVHASTERTGIIISNYDYRKYVGVGRVLKTATYPEPEEETTEETTEQTTEQTTVNPSDDVPPAEVVTEDQNPSSTENNPEDQRETSEENPKEKDPWNDESSRNYYDERRDVSDRDNSSVDMFR